MKSSNKTRTLNVSRHIYYLSGFSIISVLSLILLVIVSINMASGMRAYVAGEGLWTKAQKEATLNLQNYIFTEERKYYQAFNENLRVNLGDRIAREELSKPDFDYITAFRGFEQGRNDRQDIPDLIFVYRSFNWVPQVKTAIEIWTEADTKIEKLIELGEKIDRSINLAEANDTQKELWMAELRDMDIELTDLEVAFSNAMGESGRFLDRVLKWSYISMGLLMLGMGFIFVFSFMKSTQKWASTLNESEQKFRTVLENSKDVLFKYNVITDGFEYVSPGLKDMLGFEANEWMKEGRNTVLAKVHPDDIDELLEESGALGPDMQEDDYSPSLEFRIKNSEGTYRWVNLNQKLTRDSKGKALAIVGNIRDVTDKKRMLETLQQSHDDKEILLREIHHRLKNNLQIVSNLLEIQKQSQEGDIRNIISESQSKIMSISKIHEKLYRSENLKSIKMDIYIRELISEIVSTYKQSEQNVEVELDLERVELLPVQAIPTGLVLSEIITNVYKHGFKELKEGILRVLLMKRGGKVILTIENNGHPLKEDFTNDSGSTSLGKNLVNVFVQQMNGKLEVSSGEWTRFAIIYKIESPARKELSS